MQRKDPDSDLKVRALERSLNMLVRQYGARLISRQDLETRVKGRYNAFYASKPYQAEIAAASFMRLKAGA